MYSKAVELAVQGSGDAAVYGGNPSHGGREKRTADNSEKLHDSIIFNKIQQGHHGV